jgi:hypothetical protein
MRPHQPARPSQALAGLPNVHDSSCGAACVQAFIAPAQLWCIRHTHAYAHKCTHTHTQTHTHCLLQVESFALLLLQLALPALASGKPLKVLDCGSGSGSLTIPMAALFPCASFTALDGAGACHAAHIHIMPCCPHTGTCACICSTLQLADPTHQGL